MGLLGFLNKKNESKQVAPASFPVVSPVSRLDTPLSKIPPPLPPRPPVAPAVSKPMAPVLPVDTSLPKLPPLPASLGLPSIQSLPKNPTPPSAPAPILSPSVAPKQSTLPSLPAVPVAPILASRSALAMPQPVAPIGGSAVAPIAAPAPVVAPQIKPALPLASTLIDPALRRVLEELAVDDFPIPTLLPEKPKSASVPAPKKISVAHIPVARFDQTILHIRATQATLVSTQAVNEKIGGLEAQGKNAIESLEHAMESIHKNFLAIDEKIFQVN